MLTRLPAPLQVVSKIVKHAREATGSSAHGLLLGLDLDGTLEVSNSFPLPHHTNDEDDKSNKGVGKSADGAQRGGRQCSCIRDLICFQRGIRRRCYARLRKCRRTTV